MATSTEVDNSEKWNPLGLGLFPVAEHIKSKRKRLTVRIGSLNAD